MNYIQEVKDQFNDIIIDPSLKVARIIGYGEDDYDCYVIIRYENGEVSWLSMCVKFFILKDKIDDYDLLDNALHSNKCQREDDFIFSDESYD